MTEMFAEDFADNLPADTTSAGVAICEAVLGFNRQRLGEAGRPSLREDQHAYLNALALFEMYSKTHPLNIQYDLPSLGTDAEKNSLAIVEFFKKLKAGLTALDVKDKLSGFRKTYADKFSNIISYQFDALERDAIKKAIHELRVLIGDLDALEPNQKTRLMNRLGNIHRDLELRLPDLDRLWGLLGEACVVNAKYGNTGNTGKLIVERLYRIVNTAWRAQARAESVDAQSVKPTPLLDDS